MIPARGARLRWCPGCRSPYRADFARCPIDGREIVETDSDLLLGETLGQHYVIEAFIGEGTMARVYRAHHALLTHKLFAIKVMVGDLTATLEMRLRFAQEADAASRLEHPNVVSVVDFGKTEGGLMFLAMELLEGRSLATLISEEAPLAPSRALALARQISLGLSHAHDRGLVHRDLKPDNIIVTGSPERARIVDFGLAIPIDEDHTARLTHVGLMVGTPVYASPEQTHNEPVDHRADLFALGVTLYEMLAGVTPFVGGLGALIRQNASDMLPPIAERSAAHVPVAVEELVRRLMRRDREARFATAHDVVAAIDAVSDPVVAAVSRPAPRRARRAWIALAALAVAAAGVVIAIHTTAAALAPTLPALPVLAPPRVATVVSATTAPRSPTVATPQPVSTEPPTPARSRSIKPSTAHDTHVAVREPTPLPPIAPPPVPEIQIPAVVAPPEKPSLIVPPAVPTPPIAPIPAPLWTTATTTIAGLVVRGPLSDVDVRRAIEHGFPALRACYQQVARTSHRSPTATVRLTLSFDSTRRAASVHALSPAWSELGACVQTAAEELRVQEAPDVGTADVVVDVAFRPVSP